jgi:hypothetical protein
MIYATAPRHQDPGIRTGIVLRTLRTVEAPAAAPERRAKPQVAACLGVWLHCQASSLGLSRAQFRRDRVRTPIYNLVVPSFLRSSEHRNRAKHPARAPRHASPLHNIPFPPLAPHPHAAIPCLSPQLRPSVSGAPPRPPPPSAPMALPYLEAVLCKSPPPYRSSWCSSRSLVVLVCEKSRDPCLNPRVWESRGGDLARLDLTMPRNRLGAADD